MLGRKIPWKKQKALDWKYLESLSPCAHSIIYKKIINATV